MTKKIASSPLAIDDLSIPDFLIRKKNGELLHKGKGKKVSTPVAAPKAKEPEPRPLEAITDPVFRAYLEKEIKAGRLKEDWVASPAALALLQSEFGGKTARKEERLTALKEMNEEKRRLNPPKPKQSYTEDALFITSFDTANPRKPGSANFAKYEGFKTYMAAHPQATVLEVVSKSGYYRNDLMHDVKQKRITLGAQPKAEEPTKPSPAAKREDKGLPPIKKKPKPGEPGSPGPKLLTEMLNAPFKKKGKKK